MRTSRGYRMSWSYGQNVEEAFREGKRVVIGPPLQWIARDKDYFGSFIGGSDQALYQIEFPKEPSIDDGYYDYEYRDDPAVSGDYDRSRT